jgi:prevent-host-death family protein
MKRIAVDDLRCNADAVLDSAQSDRIVISRAGKPCAVLVGIEEYDAEDLTLATSDDFWRMIQQRRVHGKSIPLEDVEARLQLRAVRTVGKVGKAKKRRSDE